MTVEGTAVGENINKDTDIIDISEEIKEKPVKKTEEQDTSVRQFRTRKKHAWVKWVILAVVILAVIGFIVFKAMEAKKKLEEAMNRTNITTAEITRMDISKAISATGTIRSKDVRTITSPLAGVKIDEVFCKVGDMVNAGDVVVTFSREDINKKIDQIDEDITEAKQAKNLDGGDRKNAYVNGYDLETYNVATSYEAYKRAGEDLDKAKNDYQKAQNDTSDYRNLHEEAKENIDHVQEKLLDKQDELKDEEGKEPQDTERIAELTNEVAALDAKIRKYRGALDNYDDTLKTYQQKEETAKNAVDTAQRSYDDAFVKVNKSGYDASFNAAKYDYNLNKGNLQANDNIKTLERQKEQNIDSLDNYIVTAPISGLVTEVNAQEGNGYQATTGALMTIQAVDIYEVTTQIDEYDINDVKIGQNVAIMTDATGKEELSGKVTFIAPTATAQQSGSSSSAVTFEVRIDIAGKDERLRLGMSTKLNILVDTHKNVLAVPYDAIEEKEDGKTVIYVADKTATASGTQEEGKNILGIQVVGKDGIVKEPDQEQSDMPEVSGKSGMPGGSKEIPVQIGLESDYYTEVISPDISEGMTVYVDSKAGELGDDMSAFMGP